MNIADQVFTLGVALIIFLAVVLLLIDFKPRPKYGGWCRYECIHGRDEMTEPCSECQSIQLAEQIMNTDSIQTILTEMRERKVNGQNQSATLVAWAARIEAALYEKFSDRDPTALKSRAEKAEAFKTYVHERLDAMGVPHEVSSPHTDAGCRVGGRLDFIEGELERLRGAFDDTDEKASVHWYVEWVGMKRVLATMLGAAETDGLDLNSNEWRNHMIAAREVLKLP